MQEFKPDALEVALCKHLGLPLDEVVAGSFEDFGQRVDGTTTFTWRQLVGDKVETRSGEVSWDELQTLRASVWPGA